MMQGAGEQTTGASGDTGAATGRRTWVWLVSTALVAAGAVWGTDYALVSAPVAKRLADDSRNSTFGMSAHYRYFVDSSTLVLDLKGDLRGAAPVDLLRGTFQAAGALHEGGRQFDTVILAREGRTVFLLDGQDFAELGRAFDADENPIYLSRTFPEKLRKPDGAAAFDTWSGGLLGVVGKQMEDENRMATQWAMLESGTSQ